jgi:hypothetical protein
MYDVEFNPVMRWRNFSFSSQTLDKEHDFFFATFTFRYFPQMYFIFLVCTMWHKVYNYFMYLYQFHNLSFKIIQKKITINMHTKFLNWLFLQDLRGYMRRIKRSFIKLTGSDLSVSHAPWYISKIVGLLQDEIVVWKQWEENKNKILGKVSDLDRTMDFESQPT